MDIEELRKTVRRGNIEWRKHSCLIFKMIEGKPYHVVTGFDSENKQAYIITAYHPTLDRFEPGFKTRRK